MIDASTTTPEPVRAPRRDFWGVAAGRIRELALIPAIVVLLIVGAFVHGNFLSQANLISILGASAALAMMVLAESLILISGKFDLSVESTAGLAPALGALLILPAGASASFATELPVGVGLLAVPVAGALIGLVNALMVVKLRLNAFIVTLAMLILLRGLHVGATKGQTLFEMPDVFFQIATATFPRIDIGGFTFAGFPLSVLIAVAAYIVVAFVMRYHRLGRALYAIGGNAEAARAAGIRVERMLIGVYVLGGILAAIGGLMLTGYVGSTSADQAQNMIFTVFAASVIGGISLDGGKGSMFGALTGVLLLGIVQNLLTVAQVSSFWFQAAQGTIILVALMIARLAAGRSQE